MSKADITHFIRNNPRGLQVTDSHLGLHHGDTTGDFYALAYHFGEKAAAVVKAVEHAVEEAMPVIEQKAVNVVDAVKHAFPEVNNRLSWRALWTLEKHGSTSHPTI